MYGFLILLPLTLFSIVVGLLLLTSPQLSDYVDFITQINLKQGQTKWDYLLEDQRRWALTGAHFVAYLALCFAAVATVRTVSAPIPPEKSSALRAFQSLLEATFVSIPSTVLLWICARELVEEPTDPQLLVATGTLMVGMAVCIAITLRRAPLELFNSSLYPLSITKTDATALLIAIVIASVVAGFALWPRYSGEVIGMFPVLMLVTTAALLFVSAIFSRNSSPVAVISSLVSGVLLLNLLAQGFFPPREFRYSAVSWKGQGAKEPTDAEAIKAQRDIPKLPAAFREWLEYRRPAIEAYNAKGQAYPIFFVSAQGGGIYAAYHPALTLARLADACPEFAHHLFGISSVSGGSLGSAVYAESIRAVSASPLYSAAARRAGCTNMGDPTTSNTPVEGNVAGFFRTDLLSPVVASAFLFDLPSFFVPQLRFQQDRSRALESGIEAAWENRGVPPAGGGMSADFYGRWKPQEAAPALFMAATGVNFGVPVLLSQIDFSRAVPVTRSRRPAANEKALQPAEGTSELVKSIIDQFAQPREVVQIGLANILDFRPDVQLATSTAAVLSARFPFVTPPGVIGANADVKAARTYQNTKYLELTDGSFYDNSGGVVAREVMRQMQALLSGDAGFANFKDKVAIYWIRFTHTPARRQVTANEGGNFELIAPLVAFEAVRQSRGVFQLTPPQGVRTVDLYLLDEWYEGTLNWLLSHGTRTAIEKRSSWRLGYKNTECCLVRRSGTNDVVRIPLKEEQLPQLAGSGFEFQTVMPNANALQTILNVVNNGTPLQSPAVPANQQP
jgi:hypothetical protein